MNSRLVIGLLVFGLITASATITNAQLTSGDVAIVGFRSDISPLAKAFAFVALTTIDAGTEISFTDNGWRNTTVFRIGEGVVTYTVPAGGLAAGTVVYMPGVDGGFNLSSSGDQIFAFEGSIDGGGVLTGTLLYGYHDNGTAWEADATSSNTSALPAALSGANVAMALEMDNYSYTGPTTGTAAELLAAINNPANWTGNNSTQPVFPTSFTVNAVSASLPMPERTALLDAVPNPFNPQTTIAFSLPKEQKVSLRVFDVAGRLVNVLMNDEIAVRGRNEVDWRGRDMNGQIVPAGVYFYHLEAGDYVETKRMTLIK
ncbi:MAG: T9SS type A sorting domain-containing protein [Candidatus Krumholzibacteriota bacterium]